MDILLGIIQISGALGVFIFGMKLMSESLQKIAGEKMREILKGMTRNRVFGIFTGFFITALIQSSSATTVMVVSFVNAGLLTLTESFGVIMGANIGTTVTLWIVALLGFKVKMIPIAIGIIGLFFPFLFSTKERSKNIAEFALGFGILFIGLEFLKDVVPDIKNNPEILEFLKHFVNIGPYNYGSILLFVLFGTLLTIVVQSSSASTAITLTLLMKGWIPFDLAAAMILGENIGTTITAYLAALVANVHAKRSARFHLLFNLIGVAWMLVIFIPFTSTLENLVNSDIMSKLANAAGKDNVGISLAMFHSLFNILNVFILFAFIPYLGKLVIKWVPTLHDDDEEFKLQYIGTGLMSTPSLSIEEAKKEVILFGKMIDKIGHNVYELFFDEDRKVSKLLTKIKEREEMTDRMDLELNTFLAKVSESEISQIASKQIKQILTVSNELERIGDIYFQISKSYDRLTRENVALPANATEELKEMMQLVLEAIAFMRTNLDESKKPISIAQILEQEQKINDKRKQVFINHFERLDKGAYTPRQGVLFIEFINRSERIGDHIINVHEAILGKSDLNESIVQ